MLLVVAEQCLYRIKDVSASHTSLPARRLGSHKKLGGDTARIADPNQSDIFHTI